MRTLIEQEMFQAGEWSAGWDGISDDGVPVSSGVYVYRLTAGGISQSRKMTLIK